jgi:hypothetical protein
VFVLERIVFESAASSILLSIVIVNLAIFIGALFDWYRARVQAEAVPWTKSPSRS